MYKKQLSEKIAEVFFIAGIIFLVPAIPSILPILYLLLVGLFSMNIQIFGFGLVWALIFGFGLTLFIGYSKHCSGTLKEGKILPLWFATLIYNGLPLLLTLLLLIFRSDYRQTAAEIFGLTPKLIVSLYPALVLCWWITATCLALTAIYDEFERSKS